MGTPTTIPIESEVKNSTNYKESSFPIFASEDTTIMDKNSIEEEKVEENLKLVYEEPDTEDLMQIRQNWDIGSKVMVYSGSRNKWYKGKITHITLDMEGEWLHVNYNKVNNKEIQRWNANIQPRKSKSKNKTEKGKNSTRERQKSTE